MKSAIILVALLGCGGGTGSTVVPANEPDANPLAPDANPLAPDARPSASSPDAAPTAAAFPSCYHSCGSSSDCAIAGSALYDADNWACRSSLCVWTGCNSASECQSTLMNQAYTCKEVDGLRSCLHTCGSSADCAIAGSALYDADNWACDSGTCRYLGCMATSECTSTLMNAAYECVPQSGGVPACLHTCSSPSDCNVGTALYDADNWSCTGGHCVWDGCNSDAECRSALMNQSYVCHTTP